jgi:hypothetical protein
VSGQDPALKCNKEGNDTPHPGSKTPLKKNTSHLKELWNKKALCRDMESHQAKPKKGHQ